MQLEIVVAHYNECLDWLRPESHLATVYSKGSQLPAFDVSKRVCLPNVGRESHTYLRHIVDNYESLADLTLFCQGRIDDCVDEFTTITELVIRAKSDPSSFRAFRKLRQFSDWDAIQHTGRFVLDYLTGAMKPSHLTPGDFYQWMFDSPHPASLTWSRNATFMVPKHRLMLRSPSFYQRMCNYFELLNHSNPEEGHYMERFWQALFTTGDKSCELI